MKFGICTSLANMGIIEEIDYDYIELPVDSVEPEKGRKEFLQLRKRIEQFNIKPEVFNCFIPAHLKIVGPKVDFITLCKYVRIVLERVAILGGEIVVFGSGSAREIPKEFYWEHAIRQLKDFLQMLSEEAQRNNLLIAIEPLKKRGNKYC